MATGYGYGSDYGYGHGYGYGGTTGGGYGDGDGYGDGYGVGEPSSWTIAARNDDLTGQVLLATWRCA